MATSLKELQTRKGALEVEVPQVRGLGFYSQSLERGSRSGKALKLPIAQMYLEGVSTRKVQDITEKLCGLEIRDILNSPTLEVAQSMKRQAIDKYQKRAPESSK